MFVLLWIGLAAPQMQGDAFAAKAWGHFVRRPALARRPSESVDIATHGGTPDHPDYLLRLTTRALGDVPVIRWLDSRTCPAVRDSLAKLSALTAPRLAPPGFAPRPTMMMMDGVDYSLTVPAEDRSGASRLTWTSNVGTPLAAWVDATLAALVACWTSREPD